MIYIQFTLQAKLNDLHTCEDLQHVPIRTAGPNNASVKTDLCSQNKHTVMFPSLDLHTFPGDLP